MGETPLNHVISVDGAKFGRSPISLFATDQSQSERKRAVCGFSWQHKIIFKLHCHIMSVRTHNYTYEMLWMLCMFQEYRPIYLFL